MALGMLGSPDDFGESVGRVFLMVLNWLRRIS
jgi:hypothetical protein